MKITSALSSFIYNCDFFSTKPGFRFKEQRYYASLTGGIASILMILLFIGIFTKTGINTLNKQYIIAIQNSKIYQDPSFISLSKQKKFYFMTGIAGIDMNSDIRYFDIFMTYSMNNNTGNFSKKTKNKVRLIPCNKLSWASFQKQSIVGPVQSLNPEKWLCPPENDLFDLRGKYTSEIFQYIKFSVQKCNPETDQTRRCATTAQLNGYLQKNEFFTLNFYFVNTILNPEQKNHIKYYLEDKNYFPFTLTQGLNANIYVSQYNVRTDESLIPYEDIEEDSGGIVKEDTQYYPYYVTGTDYVKIYLRKSNQQILISRSFRRVDDTLSYIGGLFSSLQTFLFIFCFYNELSYQLQIAKNIYRYDQDTLLDTKGFHFLNYIVYLFYFILKLFGCKPNWKKMEQYDKSLIQVRKQMDVRLIFKKILFTQKLAAALLTPDQLTALHLQNKITINKAEEIRQNYFLPKLLLHEISEQKKNKKKEQNICKKDQSDDQEITCKMFSKQIKDDGIDKETIQANQNVKDELENDFAKQNQSSKEKITNSVSGITFVGKKSECYLKLFDIIKKLVDEEGKGDMISKKILIGISPQIKQLLNFQSQSSFNQINQGFSLCKDSELANLNFHSNKFRKKNSESRDPLQNPDLSINWTQTCIKNLNAFKDKRISLQSSNYQKSFDQIKIKEIKDVIVVDDFHPNSLVHQSKFKNKSFSSF